MANHVNQNWRSPAGQQNALALQVMHPDGFHAISEIDRIGHLLLFRAADEGPIEGVERIVGIALLRRAVTVFTAMRSLFEVSAVDPAKALARCLFELFLSYRCLAYGSQHPVALETETRPVVRAAADRSWG